MRRLRDLIGAGELGLGEVPYRPDQIMVLAAELFSKLSPRKQQIITLRFFEGLTADEVVERTGYTPSVVRHEFYRGLEELRAIVEEGSRPVPETGEEKIKLKGKM